MEPSIWINAPAAQRFVQLFRQIEKSMDDSHHYLLQALYFARSEVTCQDLMPKVFPEIGQRLSNGDAATKIDGRFRTLGKLVFDALGETNPLVEPPLAGNKRYFWAAITSCYKEDGLFRYRLLPQVREALKVLGWPKDPNENSAVDLTQIALQIDEEGYFSPASLQDERERRFREIVQRRGQPEFRSKLISAYNGHCAVTGCDAVEALEAAHIKPYCGPASNHVSNGLLLRADIHTLFDLDLIGIHPEQLVVSLHKSLEETTYNELQGKRLHQPTDPTAKPNMQALAERWVKFSGNASSARVV